MDGPASAGRRRRFGGETDTRATSVFNARAGTPSPCMARGQANRTRFPHGPVDGTTYGRCDPPAVRCAVSPGLPACLVAAAELQSAEAPSSGQAEEATGH